MKHYFNFTKSQKVGVIAIACIILIQIVLLNFGHIRTVPNPIIVDDEKYIFETDTKESNTKESNNSKYKKAKTINYSSFDPNSFKTNDWVGFGFSEKQAASIVNYKNKIKGFKRKEDLKKVYVISEKKYLELEPFIEIKVAESSNNFNKKDNNKFQKIQKPTKKFEIIADLNTATIDELNKVVGIGEYTAKKIVSYRQKLGGFHSINQLSEINGVSDENIKLIKQQLSIDKSKIKNLNVNELSIPQLKKHPYVSWNVAEAIINQRLKGKLTNLQFLVDENQLLSQDELLNLLPYIKYE